MVMLTEFVRIVDALDAAPAHTLGVVMEALGVSPKLAAHSTPHSRLVDGVIPEGPFDRMDFRLAARSDAERRSFLILYVRAGVTVTWSKAAAAMARRPTWLGRETLHSPDFRWELRREGQRVLFATDFDADTVRRVTFDRA